MGESAPKKIEVATEGLNSNFYIHLADLFKLNLADIVTKHIPSITLPEEKAILKNNSTIEITPIISLGKTPNLDISPLFIVSFARNVTGEFEGYRRLSGKYNNKEKTLSLTGFITVHKTGVGLGKALDNNMSRLLQNISTEYDIIITWEISNGNLDTLEFYKEKLKYEKDNIDLQNQYYQKKTEQVAWQKLYGEEGSFGFFPSSPSDPFEKSSKTFLPEQKKGIFGKEVDDFFSGFSSAPSPAVTRYMKTVEKFLKENDYPSSYKTL